jgi:hypothetical protein
VKRKLKRKTTKVTRTQPILFVLQIKCSDTSMTSSYFLKKRLEAGNTWKVGMRAPPGSVMGGTDDTYIKPTGVCHPSYYAVPLGYPSGTKMCVRKSRWEEDMHAARKASQGNFNGTWRGSTNLYNPLPPIPDTPWNPDYFSDRRTRWDSDLVKADYPHIPVEFNDTGLYPTEGPNEGRDEYAPYFQYEYSFTPQEDWLTGRRVATSLDQNVPPPIDTSITCVSTKPYDSYGLWASQQEYLNSYRK